MLYHILDAQCNYVRASINRQTTTRAGGYNYGVIAFLTYSTAQDNARQWYF